MGLRLHLINAFLLTIAFSGTIVVLSSTKYVQINLVSDAGGLAPHTDPKLVDPWGMAQTDSGEWWIASRQDGILLRLNGEVSPGPESEPVIITVPLPGTRTRGLPAKPTGVVYNNTSDFILAGGKPARLITATQDGIIAAWNRETGRDRALIAVDNSSFAVYTGITIGRSEGNNYIYAADFRTGTIDVFDAYFQQVKPRNGGAFVDRTIPRGYAPFNLQFIDGKLYVVYALQDADRYNPVPGVGARYVSVYDANGKLLMQLQPGEWLNAAWGLAAAPAGFGRYSNMLLVGNTANGTIAVFDPADGTFRGNLEREDGYLVSIQGLHGMVSVKSDQAGKSDRLYFCAKITEGEHGLFGFVTQAP